MIVNVKVFFFLKIFYLGGEREREGEREEG